ncbi:hypothetical protein N7448_010525, partial [Penicillium atrosanguineum]
STSKDNGKRFHLAETSEKGSGIGIEDRLDRLECIVKSLNSSVDEALRNLSAVPQRRGSNQTLNTSNLTGPSEEVQSNPQLYIGPSHSFSFLQEAPAGIECLSRQELRNTREGAISEIKNMSSSITTARIENPVGLSTNFHVPSRSAGYALLSKFLEQAELGEPFFSFPSDEILRQVIFEPHKVREKAWIVTFNYILLAAISTTEKDENEDKLRQNAQLALSDSRIFLEPSLANVQALSLLAIHGEDFAAPNISWMLLSHACRQAEALGLHTRANKDTVGDYQHKLCIFWMLFTLDKSCALAFGRPTFLPLNLYRQVPLPDEDYMQKFSPHDNKAICSERPSSQRSDFGALMLKNTIELAKLTSDVLEVLGMGNSNNAKNGIRSQLEVWFSTTNTALTQAMESERMPADANLIREMNLGINNNKFQYLHILILLLKGDRSSDIRLSFAREAISLLPSLVSNWGSVYNGVIWQLLYYPFAPFFVIFENIIHQSSQYPALEQDLRLLATTVTYFTEMRSQMRLLAGVCSKLQHTATVFLQLAQSHARHGTSLKPATNATSPSKHWNSSGLGEDGIQSWGDLIDADLSDNDFINYLNLLPVDMDATSRILETELQFPGPNYSNSEKENNPTYLQRPTLDRVFDWFSWDDYYGSTSI